MNKWSKVKDFRRQTKECIAVFFKMCEKCYRKRCKYMRNKFARQRGSKKLQLHNIKVSSTTVWIYMKSKGWKALKRKRRRTCRHGVRRIWKLYSKGDRLANSHDVNPLETIWIIIDEKNIQRTSPQITGRAKAVTTLRLETCACRHILGARTFYTSPLRKCQKT